MTLRTELRFLSKEPELLLSRSGLEGSPVVVKLERKSLEVLALVALANRLLQKSTKLVSRAAVANFFWTEGSPIAVGVSGGQETPTEKDQPGDASKIRNPGNNLSVVQSQINKAFRAALSEFLGKRGGNLKLPDLLGTQADGTQQGGLAIWGQLTRSAPSDPQTSNQFVFDVLELPLSALGSPVSKNLLEVSLPLEILDPVLTVLDLDRFTKTKQAPFGDLEKLRDALQSPHKTRLIEEVVLGLTRDIDFSKLLPQLEALEGMLEVPIDWSGRDFRSFNLPSGFNLEGLVDDCLQFGLEDHSQSQDRASKPTLDHLLEEISRIEAPDRPWLGPKDNLHNLLLLLKQASDQPIVAVIEGEPGTGKTRLAEELELIDGDWTRVSEKDALKPGYVLPQKHWVLFDNFHLANSHLFNAVLELSRRTEGSAVLILAYDSTQTHPALDLFFNKLNIKRWIHLKRLGNKDLASIEGYFDLQPHTAELFRLSNGIPRHLWLLVKQYDFSRSLMPSPELVSDPEFKPVQWHYNRLSPQAQELLELLALEPPPLGLERLKDIVNGVNPRLLNDFDQTLRELEDQRVLNRASDGTAEVHNHLVCWYTQLSPTVSKGTGHFRLARHFKDDGAASSYHWKEYFFPQSNSLSPEQSIEVRNEAAATFIWRGKLLGEQGHLEESLDWFACALEVRPSDTHRVDALIERSKIFERHFKYHQAQKELEDPRLGLDNLHGKAKAKLLNAKGLLRLTGFNDRQTLEEHALAALKILVMENPALSREELCAQLMSQIETRLGKDTHHLEPKDYLLSLRREELQLVANSDLSTTWLTISDAISNLGLAQLYKGQLEEALLSQRNALAIRENLEPLLDPRQYQNYQAKSYNNLGLVYRALGRRKNSDEQSNLKHARYFLTEALQLFEDLGQKIEATRLYANLAWFWYDQGDIEEANRLIERARTIHDQEWPNSVLVNIGMLEFSQGRLEFARKRFAIAAERPEDNPLRRRIALVNLVEVDLLQGQIAEAEARLKSMGPVDDEEVSIAKFLQLYFEGEVRCLKGERSHAMDRFRRCKGLVDIPGLETKYKLLLPSRLARLHPDPGIAHKALKAAANLRGDFLKECVQVSQLSIQVAHRQWNGLVRQINQSLLQTNTNLKVNTPSSVIEPLYRYELARLWLDAARWKEDYDWFNQAEKLLTEASGHRLEKNFDGWLR